LPGKRSLCAVGFAKLDQSQLRYNSINLDLFPVYCNINIENLNTTELVVTRLNLKRSEFLQSRTKGRTWSDIPVKLDQPGCKSRKTLVLNNVPFQLEGEIDGCHINLRAQCQLFIAGVAQTGHGEKHLNFVEDGRNECWLKLIKRAQTKISQ